MIFFFSSTGRVDLSILNNIPVVGCNKAISRFTEVGGRGRLASFFQFPGKGPSVFAALPLVWLWGRRMWKCTAILPPQTDNQSGLDLPALWSSIYKMSCRSRTSVSVCCSLEMLPKWWELAQQETSFLLKAQSFRLVSNLHPVKRILFVKPKQTKNAPFK